MSVAGENLLAEDVWKLIDLDAAVPIGEPIAAELDAVLAECRFSVQMAARQGASGSPTGDRWARNTKMWGDNRSDAVVDCCRVR